MIQTCNPSFNNDSCLTVTIVAGQAHRALPLLASAQPNPLINKVTERRVKYRQSIGFDAMKVVKKSRFLESFTMSVTLPE